jgi:hypothetical protein
MQGFRNKKTGEFFRNDFQSGFRDKEHAVEVLGFVGDDEEWELVKVSPSDIQSLLPAPVPGKTDIELLTARVDALELAISKGVIAS